MIIICLEGCHGCGKTELCRRFEAAGFNVLDEAFLDMPEYMLHPQSLLMETTWVCAWFKRILQKANELKTGGTQSVFIADRSPFSAVFYAANNTGSLLEPVIRAHMKEVREAAGIEVYTVYLRVERELLWSRIQARLKREPGRVKYNEDKRSWMESTLNFYDHFKWDMHADNNHTTLEDLRDLLIAKVAGRSPRFTQTLMAPSSPFSEAARAACSPVPTRSSTDAPSTAASPASRAAGGAGAGAGAGSAFVPVPGSSPASSDAALQRTGAVKRKGAPSPCSPDSVTAVERRASSVGSDAGVEAKLAFKASRTHVPHMASLDA